MASCIGQSCKRDGWRRTGIGLPTKSIIFPAAAADFDVSQDRGTESFALELLRLLICFWGGFPGGPFPRLCFLGCRSANSSDLLFFLVSDFRASYSSFPSIELLSPDVLCWLKFAGISGLSSKGGVSPLSTLRISTDCCGVEIFWQLVLMNRAWVKWPLCSWSKHFSRALKASMSLCPASIKDLASSVCENHELVFLNTLRMLHYLDPSNLHHHVSLIKLTGAIAASHIICG